MRQQFRKTAIAVGMSAVILPWSSQVFAETRIDTVFLDTESQRLLIDGAEFKKDFSTTKAKVFVSLGGKRLEVDLAATTDNHVEADYSAAFRNGIASGNYQVFVSRVDVIDGIRIGAHEVPVEKQATFSLSVGGGNVFRGPWISGTTYLPDDVVTYAGSSFVNVLRSKSQRPDQFPNQWVLLAQAGARGPIGPAGPPGGR
jgi:hypothetical protein